METKKNEEVKADEIKADETTRVRKTIHQNPAVLLYNEESLDFENKEAAEKHLEENLKAGEKAVIFLLYKEYEMEETVTIKLKSK